MLPEGEWMESKPQKTKVNATGLVAEENKC